MERNLTHFESENTLRQDHMYKVREALTASIRISSECISDLYVSLHTFLVCS